MSKTIRRKSGDQSFLYDSQRWNHYYGRSNVGRKYVKVEVEEFAFQKWDFVTQQRVDKMRKVVKEVRVNFTVDNPKSYIELLEEAVDRQYWIDSMTRDGISEFYKPGVKWDARKQRRSDNRKELARLAKINDYEDMQYIDSKRNSDVWKFD